MGDRGNVYYMRGYQPNSLSPTHVHTTNTINTPTIIPTPHPKVNKKITTMFSHSSDLPLVLYNRGTTHFLIGFFTPLNRCVRVSWNYRAPTHP